MSVSVQRVGFRDFGFKTVLVFRFQGVGLIVRGRGLEGRDRI